MLLTIQLTSQSLAIEERTCIREHGSSRRRSVELTTQADDETAVDGIERSLVASNLQCRRRCVSHTQSDDHDNSK